MTSPSLTGIFVWKIASTIVLAGDFVISQKQGKLVSPTITEASGVAVSPTKPDFMWVINDSGGTPDLHLIDTTGADFGKVRVTDVKNVDWEDLAAFQIDGKNFILVADTGDNNGKRQSCTLHVLQEPAIPTKGARLPENAKIAADYHIDFTYPAGPRDCESLAVDVAARKIILLTKRTKPPEIYQLPLGPPAKPGVLLAEKTGVTSVDSPAGTMMPIANQPVGLDITADGSAAAVLTYYGVFLFPKGPSETWADALRRPPMKLAPHGLPQAESIAFSRDGQSLHVISEGSGSAIIHYHR